MSNRAKSNPTTRRHAVRQSHPMWRSCLPVALWAALIGGVMLAGGAAARDTWHEFPIADVLNNPEYAERIEGIDFYFADQAHPEVIEHLGEFQTNRKTNAFGKSDERACQWAFLSGLVTLHKRAKAEGGNAVINIRSNYRNEEFVSQTEYRCGAGAIMAGITLVGDVVRLAD